MSRARLLLRLPIVAAASVAIFALATVILVCCSIAAAAWFAGAVCRNALAAAQNRNYIRVGIADLAHHLAKETGQ